MTLVKFSDDDSSLRSRRRFLMRHFKGYFAYCVELAMGIFSPLHPLESIDQKTITEPDAVM